MTPPTGDLREAALHLAMAGIQSQRYADDVTFAELVDRVLALTALASPPPEPRPGPWKAVQRFKASWVHWWVEDQHRALIYGPFTESQARRVERALNEDAAEALNG